MTMPGTRIRSRAAAGTDGRVCVVHVVYRFDVGGLENGVVNLVNRLPRDAYRHVVVALTEVTDFRRRITAPDVEFVSLHKPPGHGVRLYPQFYRLFRALRPAVVHTRNLAALEATAPAWAAGVPIRVHGEHGRDVGDYDGRSRKLQWIRRAYRPFVTRYVALSRDLADYLAERVGIGRSSIAQIYNGVDLARFTAGERRPVADDPFTADRVYRIGTVGRMQEVKDPINLVHAFLKARAGSTEARDRLRLVMAGDGPLRAEVQAVLARAGASDAAWLAGERDDVPAILSSLDCFVLPSRAEGISNTILEAMACALPVVATAVGGNPELVVAGETGTLVPPGNTDALADALARCLIDPATACRMGEAGRVRVQREFSLEVMVARYDELYQGLLRRRGAGALARGSA
ncbi:MAG: TIGR03088 family PEP-CTERM/XrtA system glycosyltransferase [Burkholderiales bacterium]